MTLEQTFSSTNGTLAFGPTAEQLGRGPGVGGGPWLITQRSQRRFSNKTLPGRPSGTRLEPRARARGGELARTRREAKRSPGESAMRCL